MLKEYFAEQIKPYKKLGGMGRLLNTRRSVLDSMTKKSFGKVREALAHKL